MAQEPYVKKYYPRWITTEQHGRMIVNTQEHHSAIIGKPVDEQGNVIEEGPRPPTLETVIAAGYAKEVAEKIVAEEQYKYDNDYPPYGDNVPPEPVASGDGVPVGPVSDPPPGAEPIQPGQTESEPQPEVAAPVENPATEPTPADAVPATDNW